MSFSVWKEQPPFAEEDLTIGEKIFRVGEVWVVTDQGQPTQEQVDAVLAPPPPMSALQKLQAFLAANPDVVALIDPSGG